MSESWNDMERSEQDVSKPRPACQRVGVQYPMQSLIAKWFAILEREMLLGLSIFGNYNSAHEAKSVIEEELDELWDEIKLDDHPKAVEEAVQVAATAIRFAMEIGDIDEQQDRFRRREARKRRAHGLKNHDAPRVDKPVEGEWFSSDALDDEVAARTRNLGDALRTAEKERNEARRDLETSEDVGAHLYKERDAARAKIVELERELTDAQEMLRRIPLQALTQYAQELAVCGLLKEAKAIDDVTIYLKRATEEPRTKIAEEQSDG